MDTPITLKISTALQARRQNLTRELARVNRRIAKTEDRIRDLQARMVNLMQSQKRAA